MEKWLLLEKDQTNFDAWKCTMGKNKNLGHILHQIVSIVLRFSIRRRSAIIGINYYKNKELIIQQVRLAEWSKASDTKQM